MHIDDFIWLPSILNKVEVKHQVSQDEAEEVFFNRPRYRFVESGHRKGEDVYKAKMFIRQAGKLKQVAI